MDDPVSTTIERLPFTATGGNSASLPKLRRFDPIESSGSLLLIDPTHPLSPWGSGVPADGAVLPNIVEPLALAAIGSSTPAHVRPMMQRPSTFTGAAGLAERTSKGALHAISPQGGGAVAGSGPAIALPTKLVKFLMDHSKKDSANHVFYFSLWFRPTRHAKYNNDMIFGVNGNGQQTNSALVHMALAQSSSPGALAAVRPLSGQPTRAGARFDPSESAPTAAGVPRFAALGTAYWFTNVGGVPQTNAPISVPGDGTQAAVTGAYAGGGIAFGSSSPVPGIDANGNTQGGVVIDPTTNSGSKDNAGSWAFMRAYIEDLSISGRTFDEVAAIDSGLYSKEVLTSGGRYYNDTYTNPSTLS